jgi:hypothetical protein
MSTGYFFPSAFSSVLCFSLGLCLSQQVWGQTDALSDVPTIEHVYGFWKTTGVQFHCPESDSITQEINTPAVQSLALAQTASAVFDFRPDGDFALDEVVHKTFRVANDTLIFKTENIKQIEKSYEDITHSDENWYTLDTTYTFDRYVIVRADEKTMKLKQIIHLDDGTISPAVNFFKHALSKLEVKSIEITTTYTRTKLPHAPWVQLDFRPSIDSSDKVLTREGIIMKGRSRDLHSLYGHSLVFLQKSNNEQMDTLFISSDNGVTWQSHLLNFGTDTIATYVNENGDKQYSLSKISIQRMYTNDNNLILKTNKGCYFTNEALTGEYLYEPGNQLAFCAHFRTDTVTLQRVGKKIHSCRIRREQIDISDSLWIIAGLVKSEVLGKSTKECQVFFRHLPDTLWGASSIDGSLFPGIMPQWLKIFDHAILMMTQYGMLISTDQGKSWSKQQHGGFAVNPTLSEDAEIRSLNIGTHWLIACNTGVWLSKDGGVTWVELNNQQLKKGVDSIAIVDDELFALTNSGYLWKANVQELLHYAQSE